MRRRKKNIFIIVVIIIAYWLLAKLDILPSFKNIFASKPVTIDETPILIKEIKSIGQLITFTSFDEVVADSAIATKGSAFVNSFNKLSPLPVLPSADKHLVLIARGKILAGIDLTLLTDSSITIKHDSVSIKLPPAQVVEAILNPSDFETFEEKGVWTNEEVILVKAKARRKMLARAIDQQLLPKAGDRSKIIIENFVRNMGYKHVNCY